MGLLCCKYNNQQSKQKIVPTFRKHQHISFSILQLELSQYNTIRRKYRQRKKKQARLRQLEKENRNKIVKETESKENESDIPSDGLEQTKNASHLYRERIYARNILHQAKTEMLDAARELEYQTNCRRHHLTLSNQLTDEQAHACQDIHESAWGL
jgi:hypothetical protein